MFCLCRHEQPLTHLSALPPCIRPPHTQPEDVEKLASEKVSRASELPSKGGLNPFAVVVLLVAIVLGLYLSKQYKQ